MCIVQWNQTFNPKIIGVSEQFFCCSQCNKIVKLIAVKLTFWCGFCFIPIIPYKSEYFFICPNCESTFEKNENIKILEGKNR